MIVAIIQARIGSDRLPGKVMLQACKKTFLELLVERVKNSKTIDKIVVATTTEKKDDVIVELCKKIDVAYFRGSESDVLARYKKAADMQKANIVVRLTADNPIMDPIIIDQVVQTFKENNYDFVSNCYPYPRTYPEGFTVEVFSKKILDEAFRESKKPSDREHVTFFMWMQSTRYKIFRVDYKQDFSKFRFTLDYKEDYEVIKKIFEALYPKNPLFTMEEVVTWIQKYPEILKINSMISPNQGWKKAIKEDEEKGYTVGNFEEYVE